VSAFFPMWTASPLGVLAVRCSTALVGDTLPENDTVSNTVSVVTRMDAALVEILSPSGLVDSGAVVTPRLVVQNNGTRPESIPVHLVVGATYDASSFIQLPAGGADTLVLPNWTAQPIGMQQVMACTYLAGDRVPQNDTAHGSVLVQPFNDAAPLAIIRPAGTVDSGTSVIPLVRVINYSSGTKTVPVRLSLSDGYSDSTTLDLGPGASDTVRFAAWTATLPGLNTIACSTGLANDARPWNDTLSGQVTVNTRVDAATIALIAPLGAADSGTVVTPLALVQNLGTGLTFVPAVMSIGSGYCDTVLVWLPAGAVDTARFRAWVAEPVGWNAVRCSTALVGDEDPDNDQLTDSVLVTVQIDAAAVSILAPTDTLDSGTVVIPSARVANFGTSPASVPVTMTIGPGYSDTRLSFVAPAETATVMFAAWTAEPTGFLAVRCSTSLAGDTFPDNDTVSASVFVVTRVDAEPVAIIAPVGTIDSGAVITPVCRIRNNSSGEREIPVRLDIGTSYSDARTRTLLPGAEDTVMFADWQADELGTLAVRCSTGLSGDEHPENDTLTSEVLVRVRIDAEVLGLVAPKGTVDSGTSIVPAAVVRNNSPREQVIPVYFTVEPDYVESSFVVVEAGLSQLVTFPAWTALHVGTFPVACSVALSGDVEPLNDVKRDSVTVKGFHDAGCYRVIAPSGTLDSGTVVTPQAMVGNFGLGPELVPVRMTIGSAYVDSQFVNLNPGDSALVSFTNWTAEPVGFFAVKCSTYLATDSSVANDMARESVMVVVHPDVAVTDLYAPAGRVDSGSVITPYARICNYGTSPVIAPVMMRIGDNYLQTRQKYLGIGAKDTVSFPDWVASPLGILPVACSTYLSGDEDPTNDARYGEVQVTAFRDAACLAVIAPSGRIDTGAIAVPRAVVANYGTSPALIPMRMYIGPRTPPPDPSLVYDSTVNVLVQAGAEDTVEFPDWTAAYAGSNVVRCSTMLADDYNNINDLAQGEVFVVTRLDAACLELLAPAGTVDSGTVVTPLARIANNSLSRAEIPVMMRIGADYLKSRRKTLDPGQSDTVAFPDWTARPHGTVLATCSTALCLDEYNKNDAVTNQVYVLHELDAAVTGIIVPAGEVDSGHVVTPKAWIANYGRTATAIPVEMRIGDFYSSVKTKTVAPGAEDTVHFDPWTAAQVGRHAVRCSTRVDLDQNPANDFMDTVALVLWRDAATIAILSPASIVPAGDTVYPRARIRNLGSGTERIPATFRIGPLYAHVAWADSLAPGDSAELEFPSWIAEPGMHTASCSTALHADMLPENNKLTIEFLGTERSILLEPDATSEAAPGATIDYLLTCYNNGNAADTVDISSSGSRPDWVVQFFDSTGETRLADHNGNSVPDLGEVRADDSTRFICRITVPVLEQGLVTDSTHVRAASGANYRVWDEAQLLTTVTALADILIEPDREGETPPGRGLTYQFTVTNLGNTFDHADLLLLALKSDWAHALSGDGKELEDRNHNGRPDIGPIDPLGGTATVLLTVTPGPRVTLGDKDTAVITAISFCDEKAQDQAMAITTAAGSVTGLVVEPDQTSSVNVGDTAALDFWVKTTGNINATVNLSVTCSTEGWTWSLVEPAGRPLGDADHDGQPDLAEVLPASQTDFRLRVTPPDIIRLSENASLSSATLTLHASLSGKAEVADSARLVITATPEFVVRNFPNPLSRRTRFILGLPQPGLVSLTIYNRLGERITTLARDKSFPAGVFGIDWDATNQAGQNLAPGIYVCLYEVRPTTGAYRKLIRNVVVEPER